MEITINAQNRDKKEKLAPDMVPAVIYGRGIASTSLKVKRNELDKAISQAGESNLITLNHEGDSKKVLVKEIQRSGLTGQVLHIDFFQVNMAEKITTEIPLHFIGESKAVKELSGLLVKDIDSLEVECLPQDLVDHIDIDISVLKELHDEITVKNLALPHGLELVNDTDRVIVSVLPPRAQEEETPAPAATTDKAAAPKEDTKPAEKK
jgi:large subunit ribosomal protein L25